MFQKKSSKSELTSLSGLTSQMQAQFSAAPDDTYGRDSDVGNERNSFNVTSKAVRRKYFTNSCLSLSWPVLNSYAEQFLFLFIHPSSQTQLLLLRQPYLVCLPMKIHN